ncbi:unnamed protein product, partial [Allacma fusca]
MEPSKPGSRRWIILVAVLTTLFNGLQGEVIERAAKQSIRPLGTFYDATREAYLSRTIFTRPIFEDEMTIVQDEEQDTDISVKDNISTDSDTEIDVQGELGFSIMSGLITGELGGQFKKGERKKTNAVTGKATVKAKTVKQSIDLCDSLVAPLIDPRVNRISATHIVTGITYGANVEILFEDENTQNENIQEVRGRLEGSITKFAGLVKGSLTGSISSTDNIVKSQRNFRAKIKGDIGFQNAGVPVSEEELFLFIQNLNVQVNVAERKEVYRLFQLVQDEETDAESIYTKIKKFRHCISQQLFNQLRILKDAFDIEISSYRRSLQQAIIKARAGNSTLLKSGTGDRLQKNRFVNLYHSFEIDKCSGYDMNSILLYIRGQLQTTEEPEPNRLVESVSDPIVSDLSDRTVKLEKSNKRIVRLLHRIAHDQENFESRTKDHEKMLSKQVSYTYVYQKYIFEYVLDKIIAKEYNMKIATGDLQSKDLGGTNLTKFCRPRGYTHILSNIDQ